MYADTITLFNRYERSDGSLVWYPTVIHGVDLNIDRAAIIAKYGENSTDNASLHIRYHAGDNGEIVIANRPYLLPKVWEGQINDQLPNSLTFTTGQNADFFWQGEWSGEAIILDSDYENKNGFYNYMNRRYDHVYMITAVAQYSVIPHFEIMGK